ncbi:MAG: hypothetical protein KAJ42_09670, partial [Gemmatimonadetes bacterium]|nr:hypothetical protein [Gemmatimonadota bacterium]
LILWASTLRIDDSPRVEMTRGQAEAAARSTLETEGAVLDAEWTPLFSLVSSRGSSHQFVWRQGSADDYRDMVGRFLNPPYWQVKFVRFEVAPEERAEEYSVRFDLSGDLWESRHVLPEARPGVSLEEEDARALAVRALETRLGVAPGAAREISAEETVRPNRTDWTFTFTATEGYPLEEGEGRLTVAVAGDEIVGGSRSVHLPEEWEREWRGEESRRLLAVVPLGAVLFLLLAAAAIFAIVRGARGTLEMSALRILAGTLLVVGVVTGLNEWPETMGGFGAEEAFSNQLGIALFILVLGLGFMVAGVALFGALAHSWLKDRGPSVSGALWWGLGLGVAFTGAAELGSSLTSSGPPYWPSYSNAVSYLPWLSAGAGPLADFLSATAVVLLLLAAVKVLRSKGRVWQAVPLLLAVGLVISPNPPGSSWVVWGGIGLAAAAGIGLIGALCMKLGWAVLPGLVAAPTLLEQVEVILL